MPSKKPAVLLDRFYLNQNNNISNDSTNPIIEISIDEAGRGCLFGRVYIGCVVLPKDPELFSGVDIKDSKKFSSKTKIKSVAEYIKEHSLAWHVAFVEPKVIDEINILQAVMRGMHECIRTVLAKLRKTVGSGDVMAVIDGNYFTPYREFDESIGAICELPFVTVEKGDGKYMAIAAASILAKVARDEHVESMCLEYPVLIERYRLNTNMGYGTSAHLDGIREHGITQWHRRTFGKDCGSAEIHTIM